MNTDEWQVRDTAKALPPRLPQIVSPFAPVTHPVAGFTIRELRAFARELTPQEFRAQLGPFALVQKPPDPVVAQLALQLGAEATGGRLSHKQSTELFVALMMEFDALSVTALPPLCNQDEISVGRLPDNEMVIDDPSVSKRHAVLRWDGASGKCRVCDQQSTNGTSVNGFALHSQEAPLHDGDLLVFGDAHYLYLLADTLYCKLLNRTAR